MDASDGDTRVFTTIRPEDDERLYLCDGYANVNADVLTAFWSPVDMDLEIVFTQDVIGLEPTNRYCRFVQKIDADTRTMPITGPIVLCANAFTGICIKSDRESLKTLVCYGLSLNDEDVRVLKRRTILTTTPEDVIVEYQKGFVGARPKEDDGTFFPCPESVL